jgi:tetratricopeptide (TPR) repeat protein
LTSTVAWFTTDDIRARTDAATYRRGQQYVSAIIALDHVAGGVVATVQGTDDYAVALADHGGRLASSCSCPMGQGGAFCKHCVAVALAVLADADEEERDPAATRTGGSAPDIADYLRSLTHGDLVELLLDRAQDDPVLSRRLLLRAAAEGTPDVKELRSLVDRLRHRGFLPYRASFDYAAKVRDVLDALDAVVQSAPAEVAPLYRRVVRHCTRAMEEADDSSGVIGDANERAVEGYAAACRLAPPPAEDLARWIIETVADGPGWPNVAIEDFADALGHDGLDTYWRLLSDRAAAAGQSADASDHRMSDWGVRHLREQYLRTITHDTDGLVALYAEELPTSYRYVQIGQTLADAGRIDEAIEWLRRGRREADHRDRRIDDLLAALLSLRGDHGDALAVRWDLFVSQPGNDRFDALLAAAAAVGAAEVTATQERALAHLRTIATSGGWSGDPLVQVLMHLGDDEGAWQAATTYSCQESTLLSVARRRAGTHPADAIPVMTAAIERAIAHTNKNGYAAAVRLMTEVLPWFAAVGEDGNAYVDDLLVRHKRKTSFTAMVRKARLVPSTTLIRTGGDARGSQGL